MVHKVIYCTAPFETYLVAMNVTDNKQKRALLLYQAWQGTQELFDMFMDTGEIYATALKKLDDYFAPRKNVDFETFQFRQNKNVLCEVHP